MQATGCDEKNRKQYCYHIEWEKARQDTKFHQMIAFGKCLPKIKRHVMLALKEKLLTRELVLAALVKLMYMSFMRVGNKKMTSDISTYGLTTLRKKHIKIRKETIIFNFVGKSNIDWKIKLEDKSLVRVLKRCEELPGYELFKYLDEDGQPKIVTSLDLNKYLQEITGQGFTAKDFRTWAACYQAFKILSKIEHPATLIEEKMILKNMYQDVAKLLGHTPAVCKKAYVFPMIITCWQSGTLLKPSAVCNTTTVLRWWQKNNKIK